MNRNLRRVAYRAREAAEVTGVSLRFLYYAIQQKDLPHYPSGPLPADNREGTA